MISLLQSKIAQFCKRYFVHKPPGYNISRAGVSATFNKVCRARQSWPLVTITGGSIDQSVHDRLSETLESIMHDTENTCQKSLGHHL